MAEPVAVSDPVERRKAEASKRRAEERRARVRGETELRFWGACVRARSHGDGQYQEVATPDMADEAREFARYCHGRKSNPHPSSPPASVLRFAEVELRVKAYCRKAANDYAFVACRDIRDRAERVKATSELRASFEAEVLAEVFRLLTHRFANNQGIPGFRCDELHGSLALFGAQRSNVVQLLYNRLDDIKLEVGRQDAT